MHGSDSRPIIVVGDRVSLGVVMLSDADFGIVLDNDPETNR